MRLRVKIVPNGEPNAEGRWVTRWFSKAQIIAGDFWNTTVCGDHHIVAYRTPHRRGPKL